jgi:dipeptidyl aminopeptidase/acylaminoacyl peptidase
MAGDSYLRDAPGMAKSHMLGFLLEAFAFLCATPSSALSQTAPKIEKIEKHGLTIGDVLDTVTIERAVYSPDGNWVAAVVQRPVRPGEVYGRTAYEVDPSRNDIWLISTRTGGRRNLTEGQANASGFWCPAWSPDGKRLAMLSTRAEGTEPRGGDNVRLYMWESSTDRLTRLSSQPVMGQSRLGSPLHALDIRGEDATGGARICVDNDENAPFIWLDKNSLLALMLPHGEISSLIDQYNRPFDQAAMTQKTLRAGEAPTVSAMGAGEERIVDQRGSPAALLQRIHVDRGIVDTVANLPAYPFKGALSIRIAPNGRRAAILAPTGAIPPVKGSNFPYNEYEWVVEKRLGLLDIRPGARIQWVALPDATRHPLDIIAWSPDGRALSFRGRPRFGDKDAHLFVANTDSLTVTPVAPELIAGNRRTASSSSEAPAHWIGSADLLVRAKLGAQDRMDWWLAGEGKVPVNLTAKMENPPSGFVPMKDSGLATLSNGQLVHFSAAKRSFSTRVVSTASMDASIEDSLSPDDGAPQVLIGSSDARGRHIQSLDLVTGRTGRPWSLAPEAGLLDTRAGHLLWRDLTRTGLALRDTDLSSGEERTLMKLDEHLALVSWSEQRLIDYMSLDGRPLKAKLILPVGYVEGRSYPTIAWVYGGYVIRDKDDYFSDPYMAGLYNLHLYAARGYVVVIPSMPLQRGELKNDNYATLPNGVIPALDRLVALGITDPDRIGVMGQSFGGYSVFGLLTQTHRFKAAVALAGIADMAGTYDQFNPLARGYPGIEHEMSANAVIVEHVFGLGVPPHEDPDLYRRNSPLAFADRVDTPLLAIHGELDVRGASAQAEAFFYSLYRQGKTAKLLRYWGESHGLSQSPANVRDIVDQINSWFDRYLK